MALALEVRLLKKMTNLCDTCYNNQLRRAVVNTSDEPMDVLLKVAEVVVYGPRRSVRVLALLDEGSKISMIQSSVLESVGIIGPISSFTRRLSPSLTSVEFNSMKVAVKVRGRYASDVFKLKNVRSVRNLSLPYYSCHFVDLVNIYVYLRHYLNNVVSASNKRPLLLIGQDNIEVIVSRRVIAGGIHGPVVSDTNLGYVVHGRIGGSVYEDPTNFHVSSFPREPHYDHNVDFSYSMPYNRRYRNRSTMTIREINDDTDNVHANVNVQASGRNEQREDERPSETGTLAGSRRGLLTRLFERHVTCSGHNSAAN